MLDSEGFMRAGWVHDLKLHHMKDDSDRVKKFIVMAKVCIIWLE